MTRPLRWCLIAVLGVAALFAAWRIVHLLRVDAAVERGDIAAVLRLDPDHAEALLADAGLRLQAGDVDGAERQARNVLRRTPIDGRGYRVLAQVAEREQKGMNGAGHRHGMVGAAPCVKRCACLDPPASLKRGSFFPRSTG